jgi:hypothetical protein
MSNIYYGSSVEVISKIFDMYKLDKSYIGSQEWEFLASDPDLLEQASIDLISPNYSFELRVGIAALLVFSAQALFKKDPTDKNLDIFIEYLKKEQSIFESIKGFWINFFSFSDDDDFYQKIFVDKHNLNP